MLLGSELVGFYGEDCFNGALVAAENAPGTQNFGLASKRQPIHGYQDKKLAPEAHAGKPHYPCDGTRPPTLPQPRPGRPRHRSPATSPLRTAQQPVRRVRDAAPRKGSQPTGRPSNAAVAPSSPSPRQLPPVPPSPVDERVASSSHRARETQAKKRAEQALGDTFRNDPTAASHGRA